MNSRIHAGEPSTSTWEPTLNDEHAIRQLIRAWYEAVASSDVDQLVSFLTDDAVAMIAERPALVGRDAVEEGFRAYFDLYRQALDIQVDEVQVSGDLAFARINEETQVYPVDRQEAVHVSQKAMFVYLRDDHDGPWRVGRFIANLNKPYQPTE